ncbi:MAG: DUF2442 domain-containing protein [Verrucomicrobiaceae bacterium]|nr:DUF2442 domain-containing protein [Verrucomicrobiaceae bacterium]
MSTLIDKPKSASYSEGYVSIVMESGTDHRFPADQNPRLARGTDRQRKNIVISPFGVHWPDLDEDLSIAGIVRGDFGQFQKPNP